MKHLFITEIPFCNTQEEMRKILNVHFERCFEVTKGKEVFFWSDARLVKKGDKVFLVDILGVNTLVEDMKKLIENLKLKKEDLKLNPPLS